jgi:hypothetical protein
MDQNERLRKRRNSLTMSQGFKLKFNEPVKVNLDSPSINVNDAARLGAALRQIDAGGRSGIMGRVDFTKDVGSTTCVPTKRGDEIVYACRAEQPWLTRWVFGRKSEQTTSVTCRLQRFSGSQGYLLEAAFYGTREPEPGDLQAMAMTNPDDPGAALAQSLNFWKDNAIILGTEPLACFSCRKRVMRLGGDYRVFGGTTSVVACNVCLPLLGTIFGGAGVAVQMFTPGWAGESTPFSVAASQPANGDLSTRGE